MGKLNVVVFRWRYAKRSRLFHSDLLKEPETSTVVFPGTATRCKKSPEHKRPGLSSGLSTPGSPPYEIMRRTHWASTDQFASKPCVQTAL